MLAITDVKRKPNGVCVNTYRDRIIAPVEKRIKYKKAVDKLFRKK